MKYENLRNKIIEANKAYRLGNPTMSDNDYDLLIEALRLECPNDELLQDTGSAESIDKSRKARLPCPMHSYDKVYGDKLIEFINKRDRNNLVASTKYDGAALLLQYRKGHLFEAFTKGRNKIGQKAKAHALMIGVPEFLEFFSDISMDIFIKGEVVMRNSIFEDKYAEKYKNSRNLISGLLNRKDDFEELMDCEFKAHALLFERMSHWDKLEQFKRLEEYGFNVVSYKRSQSLPINLEGWEKLLKDIKSEDYLADGIIIEENFTHDRDFINPNFDECWRNPTFAVAYKVQYDENTAITKVTNVEWNISKNGILVPRIEYEPVELNGTTCKHTSGFNYKFIKDNNLTIGSHIKLQKSGDIIPYILEVYEELGQAINSPANCPSCNGLLSLSETEVNLCCTNEKCLATNYNKAISFFRTLGVENFSGKLIENIFNYYDTDPDYNFILALKEKDFIIPGMGEVSARKIYSSIREKFKKACQHPEILMNATGFFPGFGNKKLKKIIDSVDCEDALFIISKQMICEIDGFEEKSAEVFDQGIDKFRDWIRENNYHLTFSKPKKENKMSKFHLPLDGHYIVFTGFRSDELKNKIESLGGEVQDGMNKMTTELVAKDTSKQSNKFVKANELGIKIYNIQEFDAFIETL